MIKFSNVGAAVSWADRVLSVPDVKCGTYTLMKSLREDSGIEDLQAHSGITLDEARDMASTITVQFRNVPDPFDAVLFRTVYGAHGDMEMLAGATRHIALECETKIVALVSAILANVRAERLHLRPMTTVDIARHAGVSRQTLYKYAWRERMRAIHLTIDRRLYFAESSLYGPRVDLGFL